MDTSLTKLWEMVKDREDWHAIVHGGHKKSDTMEWLNNNSLQKVHKKPAVSPPWDEKEIQLSLGYD